MQRYIDVRPRGSSAVFKMSPVTDEYVRLVNIDTHRSHVEVAEVFRRNYERIEWNE